MALYLITGLPGTGKTTVCNELKSRGLMAYDGDKDHLAHWFNKSTGKIAYYDGTAAFIQNHERSISRKTIEQLASQAQKTPIFICNDPENEEEILDLFAKVFALVADRATIQKRLDTRTGGGYNWGKVPHELAQVLAQEAQARARYKQPQYILLDATQPTNNIVDKILKINLQIKTVAP